MRPLPQLNHDMQWELSFNMSKADKAQAEAYLVTLEAMLYQHFTPAGKRLFNAIWNASRTRFYMSRRDIGRELGRVDGLIPNDIRLLKQFVAWGLIEQSKRLRPMKGNMPTGYEWVYTIPDNVKWGCRTVVKRRKSINKS